MEVTKIPYLFWLTQKISQEQEQKIIDEYEIKDFSMIWYLFIKYILVFLFIFIILNKFDFALSQNRVLQYILAFIMFIYQISFKKIGIAVNSILVISIISLSLMNIFFKVDDFTIQFALKYFFVLLSVYYFLKDLNKSVYSIQNNNKTFAHLIKENLV